MEQKTVQGVPAPPDTKSWLEYSWKLQQEMPQRFKDASKFLATIISLTITIIFTAMEKLKLVLMHPFLLFITLIIWLIALLFAFMVFFPHQYRFHSKSVATIKKTIGKTTHKKRIYFIISAALYFLPLLLLSFLYLIAILNTKPDLSRSI
jgi:hypothetical protein